MKLEALKKKPFLICAGVSLLLIVLDCLFKWIVQANCELYVRNEVIPNFFYITLSHNTGAAFSLGDSWGVWGRILGIFISLTMSAAILFYWLKKAGKIHIVEQICLALLFAGAFGNLIDRSFYWQGTVGFDGVIDYLQFYLGGGPNADSSLVNPFATFNLADACLVVGVIVLIVYAIVDAIKHRGEGEDLSVDPRLAEKKEAEEKEDE